MDKEELNKKIKELVYYIKKDDTKRASLLLSLILTTMGLLAGGVLLGTIFGQMALALITAIFACVPLEATKFMQYRELCDNIKRYQHQIEVYQNELTAKNTVTKVPKKTVTNEPVKTKKYAYNKEKEVAKKKEVSIEFFDEKDFDDELGETSHKRR